MQGPLLVRLGCRHPNLKTVLIAQRRHVEALDAGGAIQGGTFSLEPGKAVNGIFSA
jgi:membrane-bound lytic murein transglycosylase